MGGAKRCQRVDDEISRVRGARSESREYHESRRTRRQQRVPLNTLIDLASKLRMRLASCAGLTKASKPYCDVLFDVLVGSCRIRSTQPATGSAALVARGSLECIPPL
jgi:hypothetical protein